MRRAFSSIAVGGAPAVVAISRRGLGGAWTPGGSEVVGVDRSGERRGVLLEILLAWNFTALGLQCT